MASSTAFIVIGLGFGDEGKGATVDFLARIFGIKTIVRFNGGPQAAHYVVTPEGITHCFAQFGSGTLAGAETYLSRFMLIDPVRLLNEKDVLEKQGVKNALGRLIISGRSPVITPYHWIINQMREIVRGAAKHGSCGMGVGEAVADARALGNNMLFAGDLWNYHKARSKLHFICGRKMDIAEQIADEHPNNERLAAYLQEISKNNHNKLASFYEGFANNISIVSRSDEAIVHAPQRDGIIFEGAQGVLLDPVYGFSPYVTRTRTTLQNAEKIIREFRGRIIRLGVLRVYATRHGAGPLVTEDAELTRELPDSRNGTNEWQGSFRVGWPDLVAMRYALRVAGQIDGLVLNHLDRVQKMKKIKICTAYQCGDCVIDDLTKIPYRQNANLTALATQAKPIYEEIPTSELIDYLEKKLDKPVMLASYGPTAEDRVRRHFVHLI